METRLEGKFLELYREIKSLAESIRDERVRAITLELLDNPVITFTSVEPLIKFYESPAAPHKHHSYPGGLLEHTLSVALLSIEIARAREKVYGVRVDRDYVVAASILHDIFKYYQYRYDSIVEGFRIRTDWFLAHDYAVVAELARRGAPDKLIRILAETHGNSPFTTVESIIVHDADSIDASYASNLQDIVWSVCRDIEIEKKIPALKVFNRILWVKRLGELVEIYFTKGRDYLREYIIEVLGL